MDGKLDVRWRSNMELNKQGNCGFRESNGPFRSIISLEILTVNK